MTAEVIGNLIIGAVFAFALVYGALGFAELLKGPEWRAEDELERQAKKRRAQEAKALRRATESPASFREVITNWRNFL